MYDLFTEGLAAMKGQMLFRTEKFSYQGMMGITSGSNRVFQAPHRPLLSIETTTIYVDGAAVDADDYDIDLETGAVRFDEPPAQGYQPEATYYRSDYADGQIKEMLVDGFRQMEMRWPRGYRLSSGSVSFAEATTASSHAYVVPVDEVSDPVIAGSVTFSSSQAQRGVLLGLAELSRMEMEGRQAALTAFSWREDRGMAVDRSRVPDNILGMIRQQEQKVTDALYKAQEEVYGSEPAGGYITITPSSDYTQNYDWRGS